MRFTLICSILIGLAGCGRASADRAPAASRNGESAMAAKLDAAAIPSAKSPRVYASPNLPAATHSRLGAPAMAANLDMSVMPVANAPAQYAARNVPAVANAGSRALAMAAKLDASVIPAANAPVQYAAPNLPPVAHSAQRRRVKQPRRLIPRIQNHDSKSICLTCGDVPIPCGLDESYAIEVHHEHLATISASFAVKRWTVPGGRRPDRNCAAAV